MYAPRNKHGLTLKFSSQGGHFGTMQMLGGMAKGLGDVRVYWVEQRQSIPGFLAQVTLEMFEKTTFGRAAGYVPVDEAEEE
jgi:mitotic spindle assembly checkpoint protein MAD1